MILHFTMLDDQRLRKNFANFIAEIKWEHFNSDTDLDFAVWAEKEYKIKFRFDDVVGGIHSFEIDEKDLVWLALKSETLASLLSVQE